MRALKSEPWRASERAEQQQMVEGPRRPHSARADKDASAQADERDADSWPELNRHPAATAFAPAVDSATHDNLLQIRIIQRHRNDFSPPRNPPGHNSKIA